jgi:hypothetical protein
MVGCGRQERCIGRHEFVGQIHVGRIDALFEFSHETFERFRHFFVPLNDEIAACGRPISSFR